MLCMENSKDHSCIKIFSLKVSGKLDNEDWQVSGRSKVLWTVLSDQLDTDNTLIPMLCVGHGYNNLQHQSEVGCINIPRV